MIPFFGPIASAAVGYIATAVTMGPLKAIWVLLFQLVLGQVDGNLIQPKIVGTSVGISPFWVIFAVTFFGGIWGPWGMILGVPIVGALGMLYDDLKILKEYSYSTIKNSLTSFNSDSKLKNTTLSEKCGVDIYSLNGEPFYMLVKSMNPISNNDNNN